MRYASDAYSRGRVCAKDGGLRAPQTPRGIFRQRGMSADTWFDNWRFLEVFSFNGLQVGGDTWFDSVLREMAGFGAVAGMRAQNYLGKSMGRLWDRGVFRP